jgi:uncharacterized membrane protein
MKATDFFTSDHKKQIEQAIHNAEQNTSGEIRVHLELHCKEDVLDHAAFMFKALDMHKTKQRNGVLFYLAVEDHKFAIIGDAGLNAKVPENFWDDIRDNMLQKFKTGNFAEGMVEGILQTGLELKKYFPVIDASDNELSNEISFGEIKK